MANNTRQSKIRTELLQIMEALNHPVTPEQIKQHSQGGRTISAIYTALSAMRREKIIAKVDNAYYIRTEANAQAIVDAVDKAGRKPVKIRAKSVAIKKTKYTDQVKIQTLNQLIATQAPETAAVLTDIRDNNVQVAT